ncbi:MAG: Fe-Mn family superoxide dismutase [bacterium]
MDKNTVLYSAKDYSGLPGKTGFSDTLLNNHFKLYQGYVKNVNILLEKLRGLSAAGKDRDPEYAELKRRLGWEFNGMRLHEYYFDNLGGKTVLDAKDILYKKISENFENFDAWKQDFISSGVMRGIGWVVLCLDPQNGRLMNLWINEHDTGHIAGSKPVLVMDVFEHAYLTDFQIDRAGYIDVFFNNINWPEVSKRLKT